MKNLNNFYRSLVLLPLFLFVLRSNSQITNAENKIIVIDAGHGGTDSGAIGINGIKEKDVVLNIALEIIRLNQLKADNDKIEIYLTRYSDSLISLNDRTKLAKALQADVFISLHFNQADNLNARGTEVYVSNPNGKYLKQSILMGYAIEKALVNRTGLQSRGVKFANFQVLRETVDVCPAVLVEFGFLSNLEEVDYFSDAKGLKIVALLLSKLIKTLNYE